MVPLCAAKLRCSGNRQGIENVMGIEIERKFLVTGDAWRQASKVRSIRQGYLAVGTTNTIRIRIADAEAWLGIKGKAVGGARPEFEYPVPLAEAEQLLTLTPYQVIEKTRYVLPHDGLVWEVDEFHGANQGLIVAEVELETVDQAITLPDWVGKEVTDDPRYRNALLCQHPYTEWHA